MKPHCLLEKGLKDNRSHRPPLTQMAHGLDSSVVSLRGGKAAGGNTPGTWPGGGVE